MSAQTDPRRAAAVDVVPKYYYRRSLTVRELMPAVAAAAVAGMATFYVVKLFFERTPLRAEPAGRERSRKGLRLHRSAVGESPVARNFGRR